MNAEHKERENKVRCKLADLTAEVHRLNWAVNYAMHTDVTIEKAVEFLKSVNRWSTVLPTSKTTIYEANNGDD